MKFYNLGSWLSLSVLIPLTSCAVEFAEDKPHKSATEKNKIASTLHAETLMPTRPKSTADASETSVVDGKVHSTEEAVEAVEELVYNAEKAVEELVDNAEEAVEGLVDNAEEAVEELMDSAEENASPVKEITPLIRGVLQLLRDQEIEESCLICMEDFTEADQVLCKLGDPCTCKTHVYHEHCISTVIERNRKNPSCPCCRQTIVKSKIINILNNQMLINVLDDIATKIEALQSRFGNQCVKVEYLNHLRDTSAFSLDEKEKMFEYFNKEIDHYHDPEFFDDLMINLTILGDITPTGAGKYHDLWNWIHLQSSQQA